MSTCDRRDKASFTSMCMLIILKSKCKRAPADGIVLVRYTTVRYTNVLLAGEVTGTNVMGTVKVKGTVSRLGMRISAH